MSDQTGQKKTERLHMLISPDELETIDKWRFSNRIGTRAEAVRRLVQIALETEAPTDKAGQLAMDLLRTYNAAMTDETATADSLLDDIASPVLELAAHTKFIQDTKVAIKAGETIEDARHQLKESGKKRGQQLRLIERFVRGKGK